MIFCFFSHTYGPIFLGPGIPQNCRSGSMVTLPSGNEAVLIGCYTEETYTDKIYKLTWQGEHLQWLTLPQKLKYARSSAIAMMIPGSLTNCN